MQTARAERRQQRQHLDAIEQRTTSALDREPILRSSPTTEFRLIQLDSHLAPFESATAWQCKLSNGRPVIDFGLPKITVWNVTNTHAGLTRHGIVVKRNERWEVIEIDHPIQFTICRLNATLTTTSSSVAVTVVGQMGDGGGFATPYTAAVHNIGLDTGDYLHAGSIGDYCLTYYSAFDGVRYIVAVYGAESGDNIIFGELTAQLTFDAVASMQPKNPLDWSDAGESVDVRGPLLATGESLESGTRVHAVEKDGIYYVLDREIPESEGGATLGYGILTDDLRWTDKLGTNGPTMLLCDADGILTGVEATVYAPATWQDWDIIPEGVQIEWGLHDGDRFDDYRVALSHPGPVASKNQLGMPEYGVFESSRIIGQYASLFDNASRGFQSPDADRWRTCLVSRVNGSSNMFEVTRAIDRPARARVHTPGDTMAIRPGDWPREGTWGLAICQDYHVEARFTKFVLYQFLPGFWLSSYQRVLDGGSYTEYATASAIADESGTGYAKIKSAISLSRGDDVLFYPCNRTGHFVYDGTTVRFPDMPVTLTCEIPANVTAVIPSDTVLRYSWRSGEVFTFDMTAYYV